MFQITGYNIFLTRGDSAFLKFSLEDNDGNPYTPVEGDSIRFAMKKRIKDEVPLIIKDIPIDTLICEIVPSDTKELAFGEYKYDVEFTDHLGHVSTIILGSFTITEEVY